MDWKRKLSSRKFWALSAAVVTSIMVLAGAGEDVTTKVVGLVGTVGSAVVYILAEARVDVARTVNEIELGDSEKYI